MKSRPTQLQMKTLVELLAKDPQLCAGKFTPTFTHKIAKQRWEGIAVELNSLPGAEKSGEKWKKTWQDTRAITKNKAAAIKRHISGTGGGPTCSIELNEIQKETLPLISQALVSGHSCSSESLVEFVFDEIPNKTIIDNNDLCIEEIIDYEIANSDRPSTSISTVNEHFHSVDEHSSIITENAKNMNSFGEKSSSFITHKPSTSYEKPKPNLKRKITNAAKLSESSAAATRLGDIAERKCNMKEAYYDKKIKLMEENNALLKNVGTLLSAFLNDKSRLNLPND